METIGISLGSSTIKLVESVIINLCTPKRKEAKLFLLINVVRMAKSKT